MKEVDFRVFDKVLETIYYNAIPIDKDFKTWIISFDNSNFYDGDFVVGSDIDIMQYTNVKDRNKTKIYEGDIVHCWGGECCRGFWEYDVYIAVDSIFNPFTMLELNQAENIEVVGNIYHNKNLLDRCKNKMI